MKDGLVLFAAIALVFAVMVFAMIKFTQTQYAAPEKSEEEIMAAYKKERSYRQDIQETERRRKDLLRRQKQRLRDMQRR